MPSDLVVLTRREKDNLALAPRLEAQGLRWLSYPCLATRATAPDARALAALASGAPLAAVAFPSRAAVEGLYDQPGLREQLPLVETPLLATVGPATARTLAARERAPDLVAEPATGTALADALSARLPAGARVLIPGGDRQRPELPDGLRARDLVDVSLQVYAHEQLTPDPLPAPPPAAILCASPSAAQTFLRANPDLTACPFVAIGPTTERALKERGVTRVTRAIDTTPQALVEAILRTVGSS